MEITLEQLQWLKEFIIKYDEINLEEFLCREWWGEDYEKQDMIRIYKTAPEYMSLIDPFLLYRLQKFYNEEWLCASWCGVVPLDIIYEKAKIYANNEWGENK